VVLGARLVAYDAAPRAVSPGPVTVLAAGWRSACAVDRGELRFGADLFGPTPTARGAADLVELAAAGTMYYGRSSSGDVSCWGSAANGRLVSLAPQAIAPLKGATSIAVAPLRVCGLVGGTIRCWGRNASGLPIDDFTNVGPL
jgi:hypothetical protein